jgi:hypothetical protein
MPRIKLNADKLVGYMRTDLTEARIAKLGTAKLGCTKASPQAERLTTERLRITPDDRR